MFYLFCFGVFVCFSDNLLVKFPSERCGLILLIRSFSAQGIFQAFNIPIKNLTVSSEPVIELVLLNGCLRRLVVQLKDKWTRNMAVGGHMNY